MLNDDLKFIFSTRSFSMTSENAFPFSQTVSDTITRTKVSGCTRNFIDLHGNVDGGDLSAIDTFSQFFSGVDPSDEARTRAEKTGDVLGNTFTTYYDTHLQSTWTPQTVHPTTSC